MNSMKVSPENTAHGMSQAIKSVSLRELIGITSCPNLIADKN